MMAYDYTFFEIEKHGDGKTATLFLNNPDRKNLMIWDFWMTLDGVIAELEADDEVRIVVVAARGDHFSIGIDFKSFFMQLGPIMQEQSADGREKLYQVIRKMQAGFERMVASPLIFIAAVQGYCIGAGLDLIAACDLRLASQDAIVSLRETRVGIVADMGSLHRLPHIIGDAQTRLWAYTGADYDAQKCFEIGLFSELVPDGAEVLNRARSLAQEIGGNPGIVLRGVKHIMNYAQEHSDRDAMAYVATWNAAFLDSEDFREAVAAFMEKRQPSFK